MKSAAQPRTQDVIADLAGRASNRFYPLNVFFEITYACNEVCSHCYLVNKPYVREGEKIDGNNPPNGELSTSEIKEALHQIAECKGLFLTFTGGEVFTRSDFIELLWYAKKLRFAPRFFTNAVLIDDDVADELKRIRPLEIGVSIYGHTAETHDEITRLKGSFDRTIAGVCRMTARGLPVSLKTPLMTTNYRLLPQFIKLAESVGAKPKFDVSLAPQDDGGHVPLKLRIEDKASLLELLHDERIFPQKTRDEADPVTSDGDVGSQETSLPLAAQTEEEKRITCDAGRSLVNISPFGDVFPCIQFRRWCGNLRREDFRTIWERSQQLMTIRNWANEDFPICNGCEYRNFCGRCPGVAQLEDGDALGPSSRACKLAKLRYEMQAAEEAALGGS